MPSNFNNPVTLFEFDSAIDYERRMATSSFNHFDWMLLASFVASQKSTSLTLRQETAVVSCLDHCANLFLHASALSIVGRLRALPDHICVLVVGLFVKMQVL